MRSITTPLQEEQGEQTTTTTCCIVGGGPGGMVLALLLARQGISVVVFEAHTNFDREFRGDVIFPSTLAIMEELGLAESVLQLRHTKRSQVIYEIGEVSVFVADLSSLKTRYPYFAMINQADVLDLLAGEARRSSSFRLEMGARVEELLYETDGKVCGVRYRGPHGWGEVRASLVVGADGRFSRLRKLVNLQPKKVASSMDVLWFRLTRIPGEIQEGLLRFGKQGIIALLDRPDHWQIGFVIPKGKYREIRAASLEHFRQTIVEICPFFADRVEELQEWRQISVLSVNADCLPRWYVPGLLLIGDAAHTMSPVGGVGINCAIQDAVVAGNVLSATFKNGGAVSVRDLAAIQQQRELAIKLLLKYQYFLQKRLLSAGLEKNSFDPPFIIRVLFGIPFVRNFLTKMIVFGPNPVHVQC